MLLTLLFRPPLLPFAHHLTPPLHHPQAPYSQWPPRSSAANSRPATHLVTKQLCASSATARTARPTSAVRYAIHPFVARLPVADHPPAHLAPLTRATCMCKARGLQSSCIPEEQGEAGRRTDCQLQARFGLRLDWPIAPTPYPSRPRAWLPYPLPSPLPLHEAPTSFPLVAYLDHCYPLILPYPHYYHHNNGLTPRCI